ncbi:hypothetical protein D9M72_526100 [compost metagenome]
MARYHAALIDAVLAAQGEPTVAVPLDRGCGAGHAATSPPKSRNSNTLGPSGPKSRKAPGRLPSVPDFDVREGSMHPDGAPAPLRGEFPAGSGDKERTDALVRSAWIASCHDPVSNAYSDGIRA